MDLDSKLNDMTTLIVTETPQGIALGSGFSTSCRTEQTLMDPGINGYRRTFS